MMTQRVASQRLSVDHAVVHTSSLPAARDIARLFQITEDERDPALRQTQPLSHVAQTQAGLILDRQEKLGVVGQQRPFAQPNPSLRLVEPPRYLNDDTGSALHRTKVALRWCNFEGGVLRLTDLSELDPTAGRDSPAFACPRSSEARAVLTKEEARGYGF